MFNSVFRWVVFTLLAAGPPWVHAVAIWDGPLITYNQPSPDPTEASNQDQITPEVWLTRTNSGGLFNAALEPAFTSNSPANTDWAFGTLTNWAWLNYTNWLDWLNGNSPTSMVGSNIVVHLIPGHLFIVSIQFLGLQRQRQLHLPALQGAPARP